MAIEVAKYQFQSWARRGLATHIAEPDTLGDASAPLPPNERATVPVGVSLNGQPQPPKSFALVGPGDIVGVQREMIVRTEPRHFTTNFEPNYLPFVEFYDEDFPWRYTPARPQGENLRPWLFLLVCRLDEFERDDRRLPLPVVKIREARALPPSDQLWMFAHVHTEQDIPGAELSDLELYLRSLREAVRTDPDGIYSRLLSPRHLEPNTEYQAFLVPTFEVGRLAGLGQPTTGVPAQKPAWDRTTTGVELPIYFDWSFHTGDKTDFEALLKLLEPRVLDPRIGVRGMDCSEPGFVRVDAEGRERPSLPGQTPGLPSPSPVVQGLEGALRTDRTRSLPATFEANEFQDELAVLVNLPETIATNFDAASGSDEDLLNDPVVTLPFYGQNHARKQPTDRVLLDPSQDGWYHDLNRDPRTRVAAGLGTKVVQKTQEKFVQKAWQQVESVFLANRKLRSFRFTLEYSLRYHEQFFSKLRPQQLIAVSSPVHSKILGSPTTISHQLSESTLGAPVLGAAFRRLTRPAGKLARGLRTAGAQFDYSTLVTAVSEGRVSPAPARVVPSGIASLDDLATTIQASSSQGLVGWLRSERAPLLVVACGLLVVTALAGAWLLVALFGVAVLMAFFYLAKQAEPTPLARALTEPEALRALLVEVPARPDFRLELDADATAPAGTIPAGSAATAPDAAAAISATAATAADSVEARHFRVAVDRLQTRLEVRAPVSPAPPVFSLINARDKIALALDPRRTFPRRLSAQVTLPDRSLTTADDIVDAMAHPDFEDAMYGYLRDINQELLIPNLGLIPDNSISLLETNPKFIEAYMVGLNHELGRELLWREYPTDLRGSYFRQFWDVKGVSNPDTPADAEQLKDITKIHSWPAASTLGSHKPPPAAGADVRPGEKQLVLVVRGELLKRYPNTVIYAQKAIADGDGNSVIRQTDLTPQQFEQELKFPLFRAELDPDLRLFGFDLTLEKARGDEVSRDFPNDQRGWFFVIQEVPGEPRFGMDLTYTASQDNDDDPQNDPRDSFDNLAWDLFGAAEPSFVTTTPAPAFPSPGPTLAEHPWGSSSAHMAFILFQNPVMVAVHASEMLDAAPPS